MTTKTLEKIVVVTLSVLCVLNIALAWQVQTKLRIEPKNVLETLEQKLEVTPQMVLDRLAEIERRHAVYVEQLRSAKNGESGR